MSDAVPSEKGALQSFGWMLVCDERAAALTRHSGNLEALFPDGPGAGLGANLRDIVGGETAHLLRNALSRFASPSRPALLPCRPIAGCDGLFDLSAHFGGDETIIEIERAAPDSAGPRADHDRPDSGFEEPGNAGSKGGAPAFFPVAI
jgi:light-regulated signal transduction histidine kinase (bacteriophytochrome)